MTELRIAEATDSPDWRRAFGVMVALRPHLDEAEFLARVGRMQAQGYRLSLAESVADGIVQGVAGWRLLENLYRGRLLYVDDLVTRPEHRSQGVGNALMAHLRGLARAADCASLELDSGVQREGAHRFYFREGMSIASYHFQQPLLRS